MDTIQVEYFVRNSNLQNKDSSNAYSCVQKAD